MMTQPDLAGPFFAFDDSVEKHSARRNAILKAHPEVRELYGSDPIIFLDSFSRVLLMIFLSWTVSDLSWPWLIFVSWIVAGTINHTLALALHELSHGLAFGKPLYDNLAMLAVNTVMGLPTAMSFKYYHQLHHDALGRYSEDTDVASLWETRVFHNSRLLKFVWICYLPLFYALRPFILAPHPPTNWEIANWVSCLTFDAAIYYFLGIKALLFMVLGSYLGMSLHPLSGHFIAEHHAFDSSSKHETFSYYGSFNWITYNVGYHNEHHDFRRIPYRRLPKLHAIAKEFYDTKPSHISYWKVMYDYIMRNDISCSNRVVHADSVPRNRHVPVPPGSARRRMKCSQDSIHVL